MPTLDIEKFERAARGDFEFNREIRYFNGQIELTAENEVYVISIKDGELTTAVAGHGDSGQVRITIGGPAALWNAMLERYPEPFNHSLQSCSVKHGLLMSDTNETFAYLPALNRMMSILRDVHNEEH